MALAEDVLAFRPRCAEWTESVAVASHAFTTGIQDQPVRPDAAEKWMKQMPRVVGASVKSVPLHMRF